jgi:hypothetical protein
MCVAKQGIYDVRGRVTGEESELLVTRVADNDDRHDDAYIIGIGIGAGEMKGPRTRPWMEGKCSKIRWV